MLSSKDRGKTWTIGTGVKSDTTEAQLIELADGSIMINCRDNRGGFRTVATTTDLGKTWSPHPTDRKGLREPVCMGSLLRWVHPKHGDLVFFSNPDSSKGRQSMTVKLSRDQAMTWPESSGRLYDERPCFGYSCLAPADDSHLGVLYEGSGSLIYLRISLSEWFK
ncbi:MAG: sialidase family protein [Luteolibacter sp.]